MEITGDIFNIQPFSVQDGPGIRTTVFFSGCNLRCAWCHNPESWQRGPLLRYSPEKCIGCGSCFSLCPVGAHADKDGAHTLDRARCMACGRCADCCYAGALELVGRKISANELMTLLLADLAYFKNSGGGVTFSGGECMAQPDFLAEMLRLCRANGIHSAVDTAGHFPFEQFSRILPDTNLFLYDIKAADPVVCKQYTGVDGVLIWANLAQLLEAGADVTVRVPCVIGANWDELPAIAKRMEDLSIKRIELLPYHRLGEGKAALLGRTGARFSVPTNEQMETAAALFERHGRTVTFTRQ